MKTAVITVPSYFSQAERRALLRAASLANIGVIQLMDDNLAVALDFIRPRVKTIDDKSFYAFFDVGAASTTATIVCKSIRLLEIDVQICFCHITSCFSLSNV